MPIDPPSTPLLRIAENDTTLPVAGGPNKIAPTGNLLTVGYDKNNSFGAQHFNYFADNAGEYLQYLVDCVQDLNTTIENLETNLQNQIDENETAINRLVPSVGEIWITEGSENPATKFGVGTWVRIEESFLVGFQSGDPDFGTVGGTGGTRTHNHTFSDTSTTTSNGGEALTIPRDGWGADGIPPSPTVPKTSGRIIVGSGNVDNNETLESLNGANTDVTVNTSDHTHSVTVSGSTSSSTNLPPYRVVNIWRRTA